MNTVTPVWLTPDAPAEAFPHPDLALREPDGLLAIGGDLSPERLMAAYRRGIFPWYSDGQPILWWSPDPRAILLPDALHIGRSLRKTLRRRPFRITLDRDFDGVIRGCAAPREEDGGTWITEDMMIAYRRLHSLGVAHSVEAWQGEDLVGGLYGVAIGRAFFGESMFTRVTDASKVAFVHLVRQLRRWGYGLIDCQMMSVHLARFGAMAIPRHDFLRRLSGLVDIAEHHGRWQIEPPAALLDDILPRDEGR